MTAVVRTTTDQLGVHDTASTTIAYKRVVGHGTPQTVPFGGSPAIEITETDYFDDLGIPYVDEFGVPYLVGD